MTRLRTTLRSTLSPILWCSLSILMVGVVGAGCAADAPGKAHPYNVLDYPVDLQVDPSGETLWITSGNFDLEYGGGAVVGLDIATHTFIPGAAVEVGAFGSRIAILTDDAGKSAHGYVVSRDTDGLYHATMGIGDNGKPEMRCVEDDDGEPDIIDVKDANGVVTSRRCLDTELIEGEVTDPVNPGSPTTLVVGDDPFAVFVRKPRLAGEPTLLFTGSMLTGNLATYEVDADGRPKIVGNTKLNAGLFAMAENPVTGVLYAASKTSPTIATYKVAVPGAQDDQPYTSPYLRWQGNIEIPSSVVADHVRDMGVTADGSLLVTSHRSPNAVVVVDIGEIAGGGSRGKVLNKIPVGSRPGDIELVPPIGDAPELVYVACFGNNRIDVVDPRIGEVVDKIHVGSGPYGMTYVDNPALGIRRLYVTYFYSHSVGVIELDPTSPYHHQAIAEIRGAKR